MPVDAGSRAESRAGEGQRGVERGCQRETEDGSRVARGVAIPMLLPCELTAPLQLVTGYERALVDVLDAPEHGGGWEEIWGSLESIEFVDLVWRSRTKERNG